MNAHRPIEVTTREFLSMDFKESKRDLWIQEVYMDKHNRIHRINHRGTPQALAKEQARRRRSRGQAITSCLHKHCLCLTFENCGIRIPITFSFHKRSTILIQHLTTKRISL